MNTLQDTNIVALVKVDEQDTDHARHETSISLVEEVTPEAQHVQLGWRTWVVVFVSAYLA